MELHRGLAGPEWEITAAKWLLLLRAISLQTPHTSPGIESDLSLLPPFSAAVNFTPQLISSLWSSVTSSIDQSGGYNGNLARGGKEIHHSAARQLNSLWHFRRTTTPSVLREVTLIRIELVLAILLFSELRNFTAS